MSAAVRDMDDASPSSPNVEIQFLAEALFQPGQIAALATPPTADDFADDLAATVWPVVQALLAEGREPNALLVANRCKSDPTLTAAGIPQVVARLGGQAVGLPLPDLAAEVMEYSRKRRVAAIGRDLAAAVSANADVPALLLKARSALADIEQAAIVAPLPVIDLTAFERPAPPREFRGRLVAAAADHDANRRRWRGQKSLRPDVTHQYCPWPAISGLQHLPDQHTLSHR